MRRFWFLAVVIVGCEGGGAGPEDGPGADAAPPLADAAAIDATTSVAGQVVDRFGDPLEGVRVAIAGGPQTTSDAGGRFFFADVIRPYDLVTIHAGWNRVAVVQGLTRPDPRVALGPRIVSGDSELERHATVDGSTIPGLPNLGIARASASIVGPDRSWSTSWWGGSGGDAAAISFEMSWHGPESANAAVHLIHYYVYQDLPYQYLGYGEADGILVHDGETTSDVEVVLEEPEAHDVGIHYTVPAGYDASAQVFLAFVDGAFLELGWAPSTDLAFPAPSVAGARVIVYARANAGARYVWSTREVAPGAELSFAVPAAPELLAPSDGAGDVTAGTVFSWRAFPGVYSAAWFPVDEDLPAIAVTTATPGVAFPDLAPYGITIPSGAIYGWLVGAVSGVSSTDESTDPSVSVKPLRLADRDQDEATSDGRVFTVGAP